MSILAEQHSQHQERRGRLWGRAASRAKQIVIPAPDRVVGDRIRALFAGADDEAEVTHYAPFNFLKKPGPHAIVKLVSLKHGLTTKEVLGQDRFVRIVAARHESIWMIHTHCPWLSMPEIGRIFGRDHTTILYTIQKFTGKRERANG